MTASQKLGEKMYADAQAAAGGRRGGAGGAAARRRSRSAGEPAPADDNVVDAEVQGSEEGLSGRGCQSRDARRDRRRLAAGSRSARRFVR